MNSGPIISMLCELQKTSSEVKMYVTSLNLLRQADESQFTIFTDMITGRAAYSAVGRLTYVLPVIDQPNREIADYLNYLKDKGTFIKARDLTKKFGKLNWAKVFAPTIQDNSVVVQGLLSQRAYGWKGSDLLVKQERTKKGNRDLTEIEITKANIDGCVWGLANIGKEISSHEFSRDVLHLPDTGEMAVKSDIPKWFKELLSNGVMVRISKGVSLAAGDKVKNSKIKLVFRNPQSTEAYLQIFKNKLQLL